MSITGKLVSLGALSLGLIFSGTSSPHEATLSGALVKCRSSYHGALSSNQRFVLALDSDQSLFSEGFSLYERAEDKKSFQLTTNGRISTIGHHVTGRITDTGAYFVLTDSYAGMQIFKRDGTLVRGFYPKELLTEEELERLPGKWTCHPEGKWLSTCYLSESLVTLELPSDRSVGIDLATGRIQKN